MVTKVVTKVGSVEAFRYNSGGEALLYYHGEYSRVDEMEKR